MTKIEKWDVFEESVQGISKNPFKEEIVAVFKSAQEEKKIIGFYDGNNTYKVRFMPNYEGKYTYEISGDCIESKSGTFEVIAPTRNNHGMVRIHNTCHFIYDDGTPHYSLGTTCYAWVNQSMEQQEETIQTLSEGYFNKIRFCIFPKHYDYNLKEPITYPFKRGNQEGLDLKQVEKRICIPPVEKYDLDFNYFEYNVEHFQRFDLRIKQLKDLDIQADIILFHPYDRWGNNCMSKEADDAYLKYCMARFSAYRNVWWSLANEYDLLPQKSVQDWERYASIIQKYDVYNHMRSIHNCIPFYDHSRPWISHASLQRQDVYRHVEYTDEYRIRWQKPIVWDEIGYEGNINWGWGNLTGQELIRRFWEACMRGGYAGHGETYCHPEDILWWSHGGKLHGESQHRIKFLKQILEQTPGYGLKKVPGQWDEVVAGTDCVMDDGYRIFYYGFNRPSFRDYNSTIPVEVEIIDTWDMTIQKAGAYEGNFRITLPGKQWMAVRFIPVIK